MSYFELDCILKVSTLDSLSQGLGVLISLCVPELRLAEVSELLDILEIEPFESYFIKKGQLPKT